MKYKRKKLEDGGNVTNKITLKDKTTIEKKDGKTIYTYPNGKQVITPQTISKKVIPNTKKVIYQKDKVLGIIKGQQGVIAPNPITDMAMDKSKSINWLGLPLPKKDYGLSNLDMKSLESIKTKLPKYSQAFLKAGYSKEQTAGILGNLFQESKLNPDTMQYKGKGYGIGQWTKGDSRYKDLQQLSKQLNLPMNNEDLQLQFLVKEVNGTEDKDQINAWGGHGRRAQFLQSKNPEDSAKLFSKLFLRPGKPNDEQRIKYSNYIYDQI